MSRPAGFHNLPRDLVGVLASFGSTSALARLNRQTAEDVRVAPVLSTLAEGKRRYETFVAKMLERHVHGGDTMTEMGHLPNPRHLPAASAFADCGHVAA